MLFESMHLSWRLALSDVEPLLWSIEQKLLTRSYIPSSENVMRAFADPIDSVRVLIVGQDPYPNPDHAIGLAFAVPPETFPLPPTLVNIFKELRSDIGFGVVRRQDLTSWSRQGVMLMNRNLTTEPGVSLAHQDLGWQLFTEQAVVALQKHRAKSLVAVLWGRQAAQLASLLAEATVISSPHPSPMSSYRGFFGSKPFSQVNQALSNLELPPIDWSC